MDPNNRAVRRRPRFRSMEQFATDVANNVLRDQQTWLSSELPDLIMKKIEQRLLNVLGQDNRLTAKSLASKHQDKLIPLLQDFIEKALQPTAAKLVQGSKEELMKPIKQWYDETHHDSAQQSVASMLHAYLTDVINTALQGKNTQEIEQQLLEIINLLKSPRTLNGPVLTTHGNKPESVHLLLF